MCCLIQKSYEFILYIYLFTDVEMNCDVKIYILFWPIYLFSFISRILLIFSMCNWQSMILTGFKNWMFIFFWLLFAFRVHEEKILFYCLYHIIKTNLQCMKCCVQSDLWFFLYVYDRCVLSMKIMEVLDFYFLNKIY